jgi:hypothetical protein
MKAAQGVRYRTLDGTWKIVPTWRDQPVRLVQPPTPRPKVVRIGLLAILGLSGCGGLSTQEAQVATYSAEQTACVAQAASFDAGLVCLEAVKAVRCGKGGIWQDAGLCEGGVP